MPQAECENQSDQALLQTLQSRDETGRAALAELYRRYYRPLVLTLDRIDRGPQRGAHEDIAQVVFMEVWEGRWTHTGTTSVLAHLLRRARCRLEDRRRSQAAARDRETHCGCGPSHPDGSDGPLSELRASERREQVRLALAGLSAAQRQPIEIIDLQNISIADASKMLDATVAVVKKRRQRGWEQLRAALGPLMSDAAEEKTETPGIP